MKKLITIANCILSFSFIGFSQQFTKITGSAVTNLQEGYGAGLLNSNNRVFISI